MTFIDLVRQLRLEVGASGEGPGSVEDARGEHRRLVHFVAEADWAISSLWDDWHFLWATHGVVVPGGTALLERTDLGLSVRAVPLSVELGRIDYDSLAWQQAGGTRLPLTVCEWRDWQRMYAGGIETPSMPIVVARRPDGALALTPPPAVDGTLYFDYWRRPVRLANNLDEPLIPPGYQRVIVLQAKLYYAEYEDARELYDPVMTEMGEWVQRLESDQLPNASYRRRSEQGDEAIVVVPS